MKTIVFLHPHFLKYGGASKVVLEQASRLSKLGFDCPIITTKIYSEITSDYKNLKFVELSKYSTGELVFWFTFPVFFIKLFNYLNKYNYQLIYCHSLAIYWGYFIKLLNPKIKLIYYLHDIGLPYTDQVVETNSLPFLQKLILIIVTPVLKLLNKSIYRNANYIVANGISSAKFVEKVYQRKIDLISHPGIDLKIFRSRNTKKNYLFTLGRLEKLKNVEIIIKSLSNTDLYIVGDGIEKSNLVKLAKQLGVLDRIKFLGIKNSSQINEIAAKAVLGIFMCEYESFGMAAAECLCSGTPIIGINKNGIGEIIGDNKFGIKINNDPKELAETVDKVIKNKKLLNSMTQSAKKDAPKLFGWDKQIEMLRNFFVNIA